MCVLYCIELLNICTRKSYVHVLRIYSLFHGFLTVSDFTNTINLSRFIFHVCFPYTYFCCNFGALYFVSYCMVYRDWSRRQACWCSLLFCFIVQYIVLFRSGWFNERSVNERNIRREAPHHTCRVLNLRDVTRQQCSFSWGVEFNATAHCSTRTNGNGSNTCCDSDTCLHLNAARPPAGRRG